MMNTSPKPKRFFRYSPSSSSSSSNSTDNSRKSNAILNLNELNRMYHELVEDNNQEEARNERSSNFSRKLAATDSNSYNTTSEFIDKYQNHETFTQFFVEASREQEKCNTRLSLFAEREGLCPEKQEIRDFRCSMIYDRRSFSSIVIDESSESSEDTTQSHEILLIL